MLRSENGDVAAASVSRVMVAESLLLGGCWAPQMQWQGSDAEGTPVLLVHLARLCNDCASAEQAQLAADALISQASRRRLLGQDIFSGLV